MKPTYYNRNLPKKERLGKVLPVDEIFVSIQTEGPFTGMPACFVRLYGCNLKCSFCDTQQEKYEKLRVKDIISRIEKMSSALLIVVTGGEPFIHNINLLCDQLLERGFLVQLETNGTVLSPNFDLNRENLKIVVSPKTKKIDPAIAEAAMAFKYVISNNNIDHQTGLPKKVFVPKKHNGKIMLSPMFTDDQEETKENILLAVSLCKLFGYHLNLQYHKLIGIR